MNQTDEEGKNSDDVDDQIQWVQSADELDVSFAALEGEIIKQCFTISSSMQQSGLEYDNLGPCLKESDDS